MKFKNIISSEKKELKELNRQLELNARLIEVAANRLEPLRKVKKLIKKGANVNARNNYGRTALMEAVYSGRLDKAEMLIENGADVNAKDNARRTALMEAAGRGYSDIEKLPIEKGANASIQDNDGKTADMLTGEIL